MTGAFQLELVIINNNVDKRRRSFHDKGQVVNIDAYVCIDIANMFEPYVWFSLTRFENKALEDDQ
jgi:hypothetical protein